MKGNVGGGCSGAFDVIRQVFYCVSLSMRIVLRLTRDKSSSIKDSIRG